MTEPLLCAKDVARVLSISHRTATLLMRSGRLAGFKLSGKYWRTIPSHVSDYVNRQRAGKCDLKTVPD